MIRIRKISNFIGWKGNQTFIVPVAPDWLGVEGFIDRDEIDTYHEVDYNIDVSIDMSEYKLYWSDMAASELIYEVNEEELALLILQYG